MQTKEQYVQELLDKYDPDELVSVLNISAEDIIDRFDDRVEATFEEEIDDEDGEMD